MFKITEGDFKNQTYGDESYLSNWPMLYILENGKQAYIGESNHVKNRMSQHHSSVDKRIFDKVHFIYSSKFNQSVTFDYESKLIQYIVADELYEVRNKNAGMADKEYYGKKEYDEKFQVLWRSLQREKLVKHSLEELENSDLFKYSPFKELNNDQRTAVEEIVDSLKQEENQTVVVNGMPGSGKTIVAIFLLKYLRDSEEFKDKKIGFVVPQTSLRKTLKGIFKSIYGLKASDVLSPSDVTKQYYPFDTVNSGKYLDGVPFGKAVSFSMSPNIAEASLYGDDILAESEKAVTSATLSLGTTDVPDNCKKLMFGHKEGDGGETHKEYTYNVDDNAAYVGFAVIGVKKVDGKRVFEVQAFPKTQWKDPSVEIQTRGESTQFTTPSTEGTALPIDSGDYKYEQSFESESEALDYLQKKFAKHSA